MTKAKLDFSAEITATAAANLLGITAQRVGQLNRDGFIASPITTETAVRGYLAFVKDEQRRASRSAVNSKKDDARTREINLRIAERSHRLIETDEAVALVDEVIGTFRQSLAGLASRTTRDLTLRKKIETDVEETLRKVADILEERGRALRESGTAGPSFEEGDA